MPRSLRRDYDGSDDNVSTHSTIVPDVTPAVRSSMDAIPLSPNTVLRGSEAGHTAASINHNRPKRTSSLYSGSTLGSAEWGVSGAAAVADPANTDQAKSGRRREMIAMCFFFLQLALVAAATGVIFSWLNAEKLKRISIFGRIGDSAIMVLFSAPIQLACAFILSAGWLVLLYRLPVLAIRLAAISTIVTTLIAAVLVAITHSWIMFGMLLVLAGMVGFCIYRYWSQIMFAAVLLRETTALLLARPGLLLVSLLGALTLMGYIVLAVFMFTSAVAIGPHPVAVLSCPLLLFSFYWTMRTVLNLLLLTTSRVAADHYWPTSAAVPLGRDGNGTGASLVHALRSFGAACYGALLPHSNPQSTTTDRFHWRSAFHVYTYTHVAIHGKSFDQAGRDTYQLVQVRGMAHTYGQSSVAGLLGITRFAIAAFCGLFIGIGLYMQGMSQLTAVAQGTDSSLPYRTRENASIQLVNLAVCGAVMAMMAVETVLVLCRAAVLTLLICIAENPAHFRYNHADFWESFSTVCPDFERLNVPIPLSSASSSRTPSLNGSPPLKPVSLPFQGIPTIPNTD
ncbi:hypothetical protein THASP1DRAFT_25630 [Thamnocephalis sphaerospora]|uniref:Protein PNS1 n=1 Tax=Thamnocephalis sphaerospora TaxID=78915 RepID=A0A4P9XJM4_9FUNG|nr:hypothetical protein THASP1DRAFT_25630 [Thamnocephalis sphaerospora]|eukprot:RKP05964.1 hypothetical protein THASP1DRAFT_25630 [Thamnocephalis sphaerospora]